MYCANVPTKSYGVAPLSQTSILLYLSLSLSISSFLSHGPTHVHPTMDKEETPLERGTRGAKTTKDYLKTTPRSPARTKRNETDPSGRGEAINKHNEKPWLCRYACIYCYPVLIDQETSGHKCCDTSTIF